MPAHIWALLCGFLLDLAVGDPEWFPHPVRLIGRFIAWQERFWRRRGGDLRRAAVCIAACTVLMSWLLIAALLWALSLLGEGWHFAGSALLCWNCLSVRCLAVEAKGVARALLQGLAAGRARVARIVGRDTGDLSEAEILQATVETVAENATDGVISPLFYCALGGPALGMAFKAASTLDSMLGYKDERYLDIGWAGARLDDLLNYLPARLCALFLCAAAFLCGLDAQGALRTVLRDHKNHASPNCAWSEAAAAGALGVRLGGAHRYFGKVIEKPTIGDARRPIEVEDVCRVNRLLYATAALAMGAICAVSHFL